MSSLNSINKSYRQNFKIIWIYCRQTVPFRVPWYNKATHVEIISQKFLILISEFVTIVNFVFSFCEIITVSFCVPCDSDIVKSNDISGLITNIKTNYSALRINLMCKVNICIFCYKCVHFHFKYAFNKSVSWKWYWTVGYRYAFELQDIKSVRQSFYILTLFSWHCAFICLLSL